jgi:multisubunit Na+/H+ antiporter MnhG subunit
MAGPSSDYHRGDMEITEQKATYRLVMGMTKWGSLYIGALLLLLTIWFCTDAGFFGALIAAVVMVVLGTIFLREKPADGH